MKEELAPGREASGRRRRSWREVEDMEWLKISIPKDRAQEEDGAVQDELTAQMALQHAATSRLK